MKLTENEINSCKPTDLLSEEVQEGLIDISAPEERERWRALLELRARELGVEKEFKRVARQYNKAREDLAKEYTRKAARARDGIELTYNDKNRPLPTVDNFLKVLEQDPVFSGIRFNLLTYSPEKVDGLRLRRWTDADDAEMRRYIESEYGFHNAQKCEDALRIVFARNQYHPVRDIVGMLRWDGTPRIREFLPRWTKCEDSDYTREVSRLIFAGGINRLYNPGCKFDDMAVLIGTHQGEGKSTLVRWLAMEDEFFSEVNEFEGQRGIEAVEGAWICEVSELLAMTRAKEQEAIKSYLTRLNDRYRMPFDKRVTDHPRQCIFIGTTNKEQFLTDRTGNRRFYPIHVRQNGYELFDQEQECKAYIRQCWAEAKALYDAHELLPYADRRLAGVIRQMQDKATEDDYRVGKIEAYLEDREATCVLDLWQGALEYGEWSKPTKKESQELGLIMQAMPGWEKQDTQRRFARYGKQRWWARVGNNVPPLCSTSEDDLEELPM